MSLSSLLSIARSALAARQTQLEVTGHNIANATSDGYTRQRVRLVASTPLRTPLGQIGTGVVVDGIERARSIGLDASFRTESGSLSRFQTLSDTLGRVEAMLGEPSDTGLAASLDAFWSAWSDLAADPSGSATRTIVRQRATQIVSQIGDLGRRIEGVRTQTVSQLTSQVGEINNAAERIVALNIQIQAAGVAPDLRDARDLAVDQLSKLVPVRVIEHPSGAIAVYAGDALLLDSGTRREMTVNYSLDGVYSLGFTDSSRPVVATNSSTGALVDLLNTGLPELQQQVDQLAGAIVTAVNAEHRTGYTGTIPSRTGTDFFVPTGTTANTMALTSAITLSVDAIAAGGTGAPGDGSVAQAIANLRGTALPGLDGRSAGAFYSDLATGLGLSVADANRQITTQDILVNQITNQRSSISDVSVDEELVNLIAFQQAYVAAARVVTAADEMMQAVLAMV
jgi:flagellar hook-associated protein 1 FlgK